MAGYASTGKLARAARQFSLVSHFTHGYRNREDITVLPPGVMVTGSQNVLTNTYQRVGIRKGYELDGASNTALAPIGGQNGAMGVFDWNTSAGQERNMRAGFLTSAGNDGKLQFRNVDSLGVVTWIDLVTGLTSIDFNFITFWDEDTLQTLMLCVNGESNIRSWNGAVATVASATNTAGIIGEVGDIFTPSNTAFASGGVNYVEGDILTVNAGNADATMQVDAVTAGAVNSVTINAAGTGYSINDYVSITGGTASHLALLQVNTVGGSGEVLTFTTINNGYGYSAGSNIATTSSPGTGFTVNIVSIGNGISSISFASDADHGTGYSATSYISLTGGSGTNAHIDIPTVKSGTITKSGTETWAESGFSFNTTTTTTDIVIGGVTYAYDSQDFIGDTTTLYGVSPNPSAIPADSVVMAAMITWINQDYGGGNDGLPPEFKNDLIGTLNARVFIGSLTSSYVYISDYVSFKNWSASPLILTNPPNCFVPQEEAMYISGGRDEWYKIFFQLSADLSSQSLVINRLNTTVQQASQSQTATTKIANSVAFLSFEPVIETFGPVTNIFLGPQMTDYSFPIVNDMNVYDFTNASLYYYRKFIYVAVPREGLVLMYNMTDVKNTYWEAPQVMPISRFSVIDGELYGHSSQVSETYKLFTGTNDNGYPILARATFSFNNYGNRATSKGYNEMYVEGYISANTQLSLGIQYDIDGCATITSYDINGDDSQIVCLASDEASLGKVSLGKNPLGGQLATFNSTPKFRVVKTFPPNYFYEDQVSFTSEDIDEQWEILAFGPQLLPGGNLNNTIQE